MKTETTYPKPPSIHDGIAAGAVRLRRESELEFTPETILPSQLPQAGDELATRAGVKGLMLAILEDAVYCLADVDSACAKRRHEGRKAEAWIRESGDEWLFSFDSICRVLDLEPEDLRFRLLSVPPEQAVPQAGRRRRSHRVERGKRKRRQRADQVSQGSAGDGELLSAAV